MAGQIGWKMRVLTMAASGLTVGLLAAGASAQEIGHDVLHRDVAARRGH